MTEQAEGYGSVSERRRLIRFKKIENVPAASFDQALQGPVSYTHLDVYKRQPQYMSHHKDIRTSESVESRYIDNQT